MAVKPCFVLCFVATFVVIETFASPVIDRISSFVPSNINPLRTKRGGRLVDECMLVGMDETTYFHKSHGDSAVCGLYLVSPVDSRIEVTLENLDIDCASGGLLNFLDGWELNGEVFPDPSDAPLVTRVAEFCGRVRKKLLMTKTNVATILYRTPRAGDNFRIRVRFLKHPAPCNLLLVEEVSTVTLSNFGRKVNCTAALMYPASVKILQISVGISGSLSSNMMFDTGILHKCHKRGMADMVQIGGASGLSSSNFYIEDTTCGRDSNPRTKWLPIYCEVPMIRLVSSGAFDNVVTFATEPLLEMTWTPSSVCGKEEI